MNRNQIVKQAQSWIGLKESNGSHQKVLDVYNSHKPLARNYKVKAKDAWCATFVSAVAIVCGATDIIPTECSCQKQIELFKKLGSWQENDAYVPEPGDVIYYDWQDSGAGDNTGWSDHVGIVEKVSGNKITVIEGNINDSVGRRTLAVNAQGIRGYGIPKYAAEAKPVEKEPTPAALKVGDTVRVKQGAPNYTGKKLASFVYKRDHKVKQIKGDRIVITYCGIVVAAVHKDNLIKR